MASRSQRSLLSLMPGRTSDLVLPDASSNCAQVGSERKLHVVRSAASIRNLSHTLVLVPADLHRTVQVEATEIVLSSNCYPENGRSAFLGFWVSACCKLQCHALGPRCLKRNDLKDPTMITFLKFGTLPMAEFRCRGC